MFNPNLMNSGMFQTQNVPKPEDLWKNEKSKYRVWIILFGISIFAIFTLLLIGLILNAANKTEIIDNLKTWGLANLKFKNSADVPAEVNSWAEKFYQNDLIITPILKLTVLFIGFVLYISTIIDCYKKKTFAVISNWSTFVIGAGAIIGVYQIFTIFYGTPIFSYGYGIYNFIGYILPILVFIFVSVPINKIRREFIISERLSKLKNSPEFQNFQQQMQQSQSQNGVGINPFINNMFAQNLQKNPNNKKDENISLKEKKSNVEKLNKMKISDLREIAKKFSISGYKTMRKNELIESILRVSGENNKK